MRAGARRTVGIVGTVLVSWTLVMAQSPPDPSGAAYWFTPELPGVVGTDFCTGSLLQPFGGRCVVNGTNIFGIAPGSDEDDLLPVDAEGWIYVSESRPALAPIIGTCGTAAIRGWSVLRVSPEGTTQLVGTFTEPCLSSAYRSIGRIDSLGVDAANGFLYVSVRFDSEPERVVQIGGLPTIHDIIPEGPPGPEGPAGPPGPQGPPGQDADMTVVLALQNAVVGLQADNAVLRSQLQSLQQRVARIEALPGINRRLALVAPQ